MTEPAVEAAYEVWAEVAFVLKALDAEADRLDGRDSDALKLAAVNIRSAIRAIEQREPRTATKEAPRSAVNDSAAMRLAGALALALAGASPKLRRGDSPNLTQLAELAEDAAIRALFPPGPDGNIPASARAAGMDAETLRGQLRACIAAVRAAND